MKIHCKFDELVDPASLVDFPKNPNTHTPQQIAKLADLYAFHGIRHPIVMDLDRKVIAAGHGRKLAAIKAGITQFPVVYQRFESDAALYAFVVSDNAISEMSEIDLGSINDAIIELGPDLDLDSLGLEDFTVDPAEKEEPKQPKKCPNCGWSKDNG